MNCNNCGVESGLANECHRCREVADLVDEVNTLRTENRELRDALGDAARLRRFALSLLEASDYNDIDGGDFQDICVKFGVLVPTRVVEPCGDGCNCEDFPSTCFKWAKDIIATKKDTQAKGG